MRYVDLWLLCHLLTLAVPTYAASVSMQWDYQGTGYTHFQMRRCVAPTLASVCAPTGTDNLGAELPITQLTATDVTGVEGSRYCYNVVATKEGVTASVPSNTICTTVEAVVSGSPTNLREIVSPTTRAGPSQKR
jgi:hypothetical protein